MSNAFDRNSYPTVEPEVLVAGDRWVWKREDLVSDYPIADYALSYEFHSDSGGGGNHKTAQFVFYGDRWSSRPFKIISWLIICPNPKNSCDCSDGT